MTSHSKAISDHYMVPELGSTILSALQQAGKNVDALQVDDLAPVDEFHIRGRTATEELARWANIGATHEVLDVGCGLGGTARYLATTTGCKVFGVDLTEEYCRVAEMLSARVGLEGRTQFRQGSALALRFEDGRFDVVWTEHVQMNIEDKSAFYGELKRVLKPGGELAFHDIFRGSDQELHYPVPWAPDAAISHLIDVDGVNEVLDDLGFARRAWADKSAESTQFFRDVMMQVDTEGWMPLGLHLLMGDTAAEKFRNMLRNLEQGHLRIVQAVMTRPA